MDIIIRSVGSKYAGVKVVDGSTTIDLGLLDASEARRMAYSLLDAFEELLKYFEDNQIYKRVDEIRSALEDEED